MMEYVYRLSNMSNDITDIETDCTYEEFVLTLNYVRRLTDYSVDTLLNVLRAIGYKAEIFEPNNISGEFIF